VRQVREKDNRPNKEVAGQVPIIAQVGAISTEEAVELARDARTAVAAAVAGLPPIPLRVPWEAVVAHIRAVAEAAGLPTCYCHAFAGKPKPSTQ
jgi:dihydrodipicolinate synthase/N-acetylneuraminate lyase